MFEHGYLLACNFDQPYALTETTKNAVPWSHSCHYMRACLCQAESTCISNSNLHVLPLKIVVTTQVLASVEILLVMNYAVYPHNSAAAALLPFVPSSFP